MYSTFLNHENRAKVRQQLRKLKFKARADRLTKSIKNKNLALRET